MSAIDTTTGEIMKAKKIKDMPCVVDDGITGDHTKALFRMEPPLEGHEYVIASAVRVMGQPETYLFAADADGEVIDWTELNGSLKGVLDHGAALAGAGYEVVSVDP